MYEEEFLPQLLTFQPDLLFISCGFDAHTEDPLADLHLTEQDYYWVTCLLRNSLSPTMKIISVLEGGYHIPAITRSSVAHVAGLLGIGERKCEEGGRARG